MGRPKEHRAVLGKARGGERDVRPVAERSIGPREVDNEDGRVDAPDPSKRKGTTSRRPPPGSTRSTIRRETGHDARRAARTPYPAAWRISSRTSSG
jgi:hypothetical protein